MKKLMDHKNAVQLAINVLCDLSKQHCAICGWEQECSDNPLLFDPIFARQYMKVVAHQQSACAKCKLQLGQHLVDNQAQNGAAASKISSSTSIHQQCHNFDINQSHNQMDAQKFDSMSSAELIKLQNIKCHRDNLINAHTNHSSEQFNQIDASCDLINTLDNELFLINKSLCEPLLSIANKLLGRQNLNFDQLTLPEQELWNLLENTNF
jgi:hypothetical protein